MEIIYISLTMDNICRIVHWGEKRDIHKKDALEIFVKGENIILQKYKGYGAYPITGENQCSR